MRNESMMPPCHPANPVPVATAERSPRISSGRMSPIVQQWTMRSIWAVNAVSAYGSSESSMLTSKPVSFRYGTNRSVASTGTCPGQPPRTTKARRFRRDMGTPHAHCRQKMVSHRSSWDKRVDGAGREHVLHRHRACTDNADLRPVARGDDSKMLG